MNERIKELRSQVKLTLPDPADNPTYYKNHVEPLAKIFTQGDNAVLNAYMKKFAELIVRECVSKLDGIGVIDRDSRTIAMKVISEHFGVEE